MKITIGIAGIFLLALVVLIESLYIKNIKLKILLKFISNIGLVMTSLLPLGVIYRDKYEILSISFWILSIIAFLLLISAIVSFYNLIYDFKNGLVITEIKIKSTKEHKRKGKHGGNYFTFKTEDGDIFDIDPIQYNYINKNINKNQDYTIFTIEYYPKTKIIKELSAK